MISGCYSDEAIDGRLFHVDRVGLSRDGTLKLEGFYQKRSWGIRELRGRVSGDAIELSGVAAYRANPRIYYQIPRMPRFINQLKIGSTVIWNRHGKKALPAAKPENIPVPVKVPEAAEKPITHLKIGGSGVLPAMVEFLEFTEIFWGKVPPLPPVDGENGVKLLAGAEFDAAKVNEFADLETLELIGSKSFRSVDLSALNLPKLKNLRIYNLEVSGLEKAQIPELSTFSIDDFRQIPLGKVALPESSPKLHTVSIQAFAGNFDFNSLQGKPVKKLQIHGDCSRFGFMGNMPLAELKLSGFRYIPGELDNLAQLPLEKLKISSRRVGDWSFLKKLKLRFLDIEISGADNFSPELLKDMPLEVLRIFSGHRDYAGAWQSCRELPLKELIIRGGVVPEKFIASSRIEKLALIGSCWHDPAPVAVINRMKELKHLAVWRMIIMKNGRPSALAENFRPWRQLRGKKLESLRVSAADLGFIRNLPGVTRLALHNQGNSTVSLEALGGRSFETLFCKYPPNDIKRYGVKDNTRLKKDVFTSEW